MGSSANCLPEHVSVYKVGGAVRDKLLGIPVTDIDYVVVGATPEIMVAAGYKPVGRDFPVFLHPITHEEYALARTEKKVAKGYGGFSFYADSSISLQDDLKRRDLTINAMAQSLDGEIIDPYDGYADLRNKQLRHVSKAFVEDPVRVLRVARFAAKLHKYGFFVAEKTLQLMQAMTDNGEIDALQPERVWLECYKALNTDSPSTFFTTLEHCGALQKLFPEFSINFNQQMRALNAITVKTKNADTRWIALVISVGHDKLKVLQQRLRVPKTLAEQGLIIQHICASVQLSPTPEQLLSLLQFADAFRRSERWQQIMDILNILQLNKRKVTQLTAAYHVASLVNQQAIIAKGFTGRQIGEQLHQQRLAAIKELLSLP